MSEREQADQLNVVSHETEEIATRMVEQQDSDVSTVTNRLRLLVQSPRVQNIQQGGRRFLQNTTGLLSNLMTPGKRNDQRSNVPNETL